MSTETESLTPAQIKLFTEPNLAQFATIMPDGSPQVTPVWIDFRDGLIWVNTAEGRVKDRNVRRDPRVAVSVYDRNDPYTYVSVQGTVVEITKDGAEDHIDFLNMKYRGKPVYPAHSEAEPRVILKIQPEQVTD